MPRHIIPTYFPHRALSVRGKDLCMEPPVGAAHTPGTLENDNLDRENSSVLTISAPRPSQDLTPVTPLKQESCSANQQGSGSSPPNYEPPPPYSPPRADPLVPAGLMSVQPSSVITQVPEGGPNVGYSDYPIDLNAIIRLDLRGKIFTLPREELISLPESILLGISNGVTEETSASGMATTIADVDAASVNFSPECLQYTLDVFREAASQLPPSADLDETHDVGNVLRRRPAIIVLREDLDYYCIAQGPEAHSFGAEQMRDIKRKCGQILVEHSKVFSGLRNANQPGSAEQHLTEMLCSSGFSCDDTWGFRDLEPNRAVVTSLSLTRLQTDAKKDPVESANSPKPSSASQSPDVEKHLSSESEEDEDGEMSTPHKLLLFWRKPARKCWWDSMEIPSVGDYGPVKVHIRRVWTLELSVVGVR